MSPRIRSISPTGILARASRDWRGRTPVAIMLLLCILASACERERIIDPGPDTIPPLPPTGLLVEGARDGYIFIGWIKNREPDLRGYIVHRAESKDSHRFIAVDTISTNYHIDQQRSYDTTYWYFVTAVDERGNESVPSDTVSAIAHNRNAPDAPAYFHVNGYNDGRKQLLRLTWSPVDEADLAYYRIYRSETPFEDPTPALLFAETDAAFHDDTSVQQIGRRYFYAVTSVDRGALESPRSELRSDFIASRPVLVSPLPNGQAAPYPLLRWLRVPETDAYLLTVLLAETSGEVWSRLVRPAAGDTLSHRVDGPALTVGQTYYWRVSSLTAENGLPNGVSDAWRFQVRN
ncbi:MAG: hypothetical protein RBU27_02890 [Bacteroidota bacterium]|jgi:hypothetical protein|nr:hypothetical protein [Bacteroidota bacterium]